MKKLINFLRVSKWNIDGTTTQAQHDERRYKLQSSDLKLSNKYMEGGTNVIIDNLFRLNHHTKEVNPLLGKIIHLDKKSLVG